MGRNCRRQNLMQEIKHSAFGLAKGRDLTSDDFYAINSNAQTTIAIICDGVGSAEAGGRAAQRVASYLSNNFKVRPKAWGIEKSIQTFITSINAILYQESIENYERSELLTTLALVVIEGDRLYGANVGDSRVYLHRGGVLKQLSLDHIEQEKSHILTQAIGAQNSVEPFYFENILEQNDKILLCSDGLYNTLSYEYMQKNLHLGAHYLVKEASYLTSDNLADDTTALVIEIVKKSEFSTLKMQKVDIAKNLQAKDIIDGYTLECSLNENTWEAYKKTKRYILKFAPKEALDDEKILDFFIKEAWNAKRLKAPFFPKAVIPKNRTHRYYVMQKIEGQNLHEMLLEQPLKVDDTLKLCAILLSMSAYLLKYDLVHGDIKPHNIMLLTNGQNVEFKIVDFGLTTEIFSTNSKAGTPSFLSPERFLNEAISESSEIFSIGVTLYYALTKKYPYGEIEPFQTPSFKEAKKPSFYNQNIPHWLDSIILRSIALDKEQRYAHYSEMDYELKNPQKVAPYFSKNISLIKQHEVFFYKLAFITMTIINIALLIWINSK